MSGRTLTARSDSGRKSLPYGCRRCHCGTGRGCAARRAMGWVEHTHRIDRTQSPATRRRHHPRGAHRRPRNHVAGQPPRDDAGAKCARPRSSPASRRSYRAPRRVGRRHRRETGRCAYPRGGPPRGARHSTGPRTAAADRRRGTVTPRIMAPAPAARRRFSATDYADSGVGRNHDRIRRPGMGRAANRSGVRRRPASLGSTPVRSGHRPSRDVERAGLADDQSRQGTQQGLHPFSASTMHSLAAPSGTPDLHEGCESRQFAAEVSISAV